VQAFAVIPFGSETHRFSLSLATAVRDSESVSLSNSEREATLLEAYERYFNEEFEKMTDADPDVNVEEATETIDKKWEELSEQEKMVSFPSFSFLILT